MMKEKFETEWGTARLRKDGYYYISTKENNGQLLHRLIYEKEYGPIPKDFVVHHIDGDKSNFDISNLMLLKSNNHHSLHMKGCNHPRWNNGKIDKFGGIEFLSASKNKGMTMQEIADECGYSNASSVFHYLRHRNLSWNKI